MMSTEEKFGLKHLIISLFSHKLQGDKYLKAAHEISPFNQISFGAKCQLTQHSQSPKKIHYVATMSTECPV